MIFKSNFFNFSLFLLSLKIYTIYTVRPGCQFNTYFGAKISCEDKHGNKVDCLRNPYQIATLYGQCKAPHYQGKDGIDAHEINCTEDGKWSDYVEDICVPVCVEYLNPLETKRPPNITYPTPYVKIFVKKGNPKRFPGIIINEDTILTKYKWIQNIRNITNIQVKIFLSKKSSFKHYSSATAQDYSEDRLQNLTYDRLGTLTLENPFTFDEKIKPACPSIVNVTEFSESNGLEKYKYWRPLKYTTMCKNPNILLNENKIAKFCNRKPCKYDLDYDEVHTFCKIGYINDNNKSPSRSGYIAECNKNFEWGAVWTIWGEENDCQLACGKYPGYWSKKNQTFFQQTIYNGQKTDISSVPWHVGIFANNTDVSNDFIQICGGSIVHTNVVISAAHCFYNAVLNKLFPASNFLIGAGKTFRSFEAEEDFQFYSNVEKIFFPKNYKPSPIANDIAVVKLSTHLKYNFHIQPICLNFKEEENYQYSSKTEGYIVGWGSTSYKDEPSANLMTENFYTLSTSECKKMVDVNSRSEITGDKICIKSKVNASACRGDSGGGFVINDYIFDGQEKYLLPTLAGIISVGTNSDPNIYCSDESITVVTNIQFYENFVKAAIDKSHFKTILDSK